MITLRILLVYLFLFGIVIGETCYYGDECPVDGGSNPRCGRTIQKEIDEGLYAINLCGGQKPKAFGGKFDISGSVPGNITDIVILEHSGCSLGTGVGTNYFQAHCQCGGTCVIHGNWQIRYKKNSSSIVQKAKKQQIKLCEPGLCCLCQNGQFCSSLCQINKQICISCQTLIKSLIK